MRGAVRHAPDAVLAGSAVLAAAGMSAAGLTGAAASALDQVNNVSPVWTATGLLAACAAIPLARRKGPRIALAAIVAIAAGTLILPELVAGAGPRGADAPAIKIVTFNVWKKNPLSERAAQWLIDQKADVLVVSEVTPSFRVLMSRAYPHSISCLPGGGCSTVIYTKDKPIAGGGLARGGDPEARTALSAAWAEVDAPGGPITILALHLNHPWPLGRHHDEMPEVARFLDGRPRGRLVVAGDLNRTPWSHAIKAVDDTLGIRRATHAIPTWPAGSWIPTIFPIDHVYAGSGLSVTDVHAGPYMGSDHLPVVASIANAVE